MVVNHHAWDRFCFRKRCTHPTSRPAAPPPQAHLAITHEASPEALALLGEVCLARGEHRRALGWLTRAQQLREVRDAWGAASAADGSPQHGAAPPSHPLQHIAACHEALGEHHEAKAALERIPAHHRTPGVWFSLGRLYTREQGRRSSAIAAYQVQLILHLHFCADQLVPLH